MAGIASRRRARQRRGARDAAPGTARKGHSWRTRACGRVDRRSRRGRVRAGPVKSRRPRGGDRTETAAGLQGEEPLALGKCT
jgi:hypothetical protein